MVTTNGSNSGLAQGEQDQSGLKAAGTYTVIITDSSNDCDRNKSSTLLSEPAELTLDLDLSVFGAFSIKCFGDDNGSIDLTITGGSGSYTIVWSTSDGGTGSSTRSGRSKFGLGPGTYTVKVTDSNNVEVLLKQFKLQNPSLSSSLIVQYPLFNGYAISCNGGNNGSIDISTSGATGTYTLYIGQLIMDQDLTAGAEDQIWTYCRNLFLNS